MIFSLKILKNYIVRCDFWGRRQVVACRSLYIIYPKYLATKIQNVRHNDDISVVATTTLDVSTPSCPIFLAII